MHHTSPLNCAMLIIYFSRDHKSSREIICTSLYSGARIDVSPEQPAPFPFNHMKKFRMFYSNTITRLGLKNYKYIIDHIMFQTYEQIKAVLPITLHILLYMAIFFATSTRGGVGLTGGMFAAIFGLMLFMEGLRFGIMPLGEKLGTQMPLKLPLAGTLTISAILGVLGKLMID